MKELEGMILGSVYICVGIGSILSEYLFPGCGFIIMGLVDIFKNNRNEL